MLPPAKPPPPICKRKIFMKKLGVHIGRKWPICTVVLDPLGCQTWKIVENGNLLIAADYPVVSVHAA